MLEHEPDDSEIHSDCTRFNVDIPEEASVILWKIWRYTRPAQYSTLPACLDALSRDSNLYSALKRAHSEGSYEVIQNWASSNDIFESPSADYQAEKLVQNFLQEIEGSIIEVVAGRTSIPTWIPPDVDIDPADQHHITNLKIPVLGGKPSLLLHNWGLFSSNPSLKKRLENIFMPNSHTFLVNTSGSGKTRLLLEGLCLNWGFYFTSVVSSQLGSSDIQKSIQTHVPDSPQFHSNVPSTNSPNYTKTLRHNRKIASRIFRRVFLARLIIFTFFVEKVDLCRDPYAPFDEYRKRWLLLQVLPQLGHPKTWDVFDKLANLLSSASDAWVMSSSQIYLERARELSACEKEGTQESTPFFCVLDEAQFAATQHMQSFRSDQNDCPRPILREIVRAWEEQSSGQGVFMVVAGTGISKDVVDSAMTSAIMKESKYRWCSDTGAFDKPDIQRQYLIEYLPKSLIQSEPGARLLERLWYWLRGRYRFTAGYISELIRNGFRQPHRLLNAYVQHFTKFSISDAVKYVENEDTRSELPKLSQYCLDFSKLMKSSDMLTTIHRITTHYWMRSITEPIGGDEAMYVEYGFARFVDSETQNVTIDEPLILLAAIQWLNSNHQSTYKFLANDIRTHTPVYNGFENYIAFSLDLIFSQQRRLSEVFHFHGTPPAWAHTKASLVSVFCDDAGCLETSDSSFSQSLAPSATLGINAKNPEVLLSWLGHRLHAPFCFPHKLMGPDILFALELSDGNHIWVAIQTKLSNGTKGVLPKNLLLHAMKSVTPSSYFLNKNGQPNPPASHAELRGQISELLLGLPMNKTKAGKYNLLRVVASFPGQTRINRYLEKDPDQDGHPIATLNMDLVTRITKNLSPSDILTKMKRMMEDQESGRDHKDKKMTTKRRKEHEQRSRSSRKKIKLN